MDVDSDALALQLAPFAPGVDVHLVASVTGDVTLAEIEWSLADGPEVARAARARAILRAFQAPNLLYRRIATPDPAEVAAYCTDCGAALRAHFVASPCPACTGRGRRPAAP
jgi:hypothetical protein